MLRSVLIAFRRALPFGITMNEESILNRDSQQADPLRKTAGEIGQTELTDRKKNRADDRRIGIRCSEAASGGGDLRISGTLPPGASRATVIHPGK